MTPRDIAGLRADGRMVFARFGAPWCGHSRAMNPAWKQLTALYPDAVVDVDCTSPDGKQVCKENKVTGFPTLLLMSRERTEEYEGPRTFEAMRGWLEARRRGDPAPTTMSGGALTEEGLARARKDGVPLFVRFGAPWCRYSKAMDGDWAKLRAELPFLVADVDCARDSALCQANDVRGFPTLLFIRGQHVERYNAARKYANMRGWLAERLGEAA